jgi:hypothetical protein
MAGSDTFSSRSAILSIILVAGDDSAMDKIALRLLKVSLPAIKQPLADIFNVSISTGVFPASWKVAQVVPVYKRGNRADYNSYRPISLLPLLSKVMEHLVHRQVKEYLDKHQLLHNAQHGFRSKRSCCSALLMLSSRLSDAKNNGLYSSLAALDYSRAFDTISHDILVQKMAAKGFDKQAQTWFASYLAGRAQYVCYNGAQSDLLPTSHGVPQGSVMGPTLFLLYIDDLFTLLPPGSAVGYADDVTLVASGDTASAAAAAQQSLLDIVSRWSCDNVLRLNSVKCTSMCIAPSKRKATSTCAPALNVNGCPISCVLSVKILGVTFTSDLDWRLHAQCVRGKLASKLAVLRRVGSSLNARRHIYVTCIKPHIEYCLPVWAFCGGEEASIDKLLVRAKRIITNCKSGAVVNDDFNLYSIATFANLRFLSVVCQYFYFVH